MKRFDPEEFGQAKGPQSAYEETVIETMKGFESEDVSQSEDSHSISEAISNRSARSFDPETFGQAKHPQSVSRVESNSLFEKLAGSACSDDDMHNARQKSMLVLG